MVKLPNQSLHVVYELIISSPSADPETAINMLINERFSMVNPPFDWRVIAHAYRTVPETNQREHVYTHFIRNECVEKHFLDTQTFTKDIRSVVIYADPHTGKQYEIGGDWVHGPLNVDAAIAKQTEDERFENCWTYVSHKKRSRNYTFV